MDPAAVARKFAEQQQRIAYWNELAQWGYTLWFVAFAAAAVLLIAAVFMPRYAEDLLRRGAGNPFWLSLSRYRSQCFHLGGILLLVLSAISFQAEVDQSRGFVVEDDKRKDRILKQIAKKGDPEAALRAQYMYMPTGNSLYYMTAGNPGLAADYIWLTSQQYVHNTFRRGQKFEMLLRFYRTMLELDPHWTEAIVNAGKVLSALEPNRYAVEAFYAEALVRNPGSKTIPYEAGRLFVVPPVNQELRRDYAQRAVEWFQMAAKRREKEPPSKERDKELSALKDLIARMSLESTAYELADQMLWNNLTDPSSSPEYRFVAARDWLNARSLVMTNRLQHAIQEYRKANFFYPLFLHKVLPRVHRDPIFENFDENGLPLDAYGYPFVYNPVTGRVFSKGVKARETLQATEIVIGVCSHFLAERGRPAENLEELQAFAIEYFSNPYNPPTPSITAAIGQELNVTTNPLGDRWTLNSAGIVDRPEICEPNVLFKNADRLLQSLGFTD